MRCPICKREVEGSERNKPRSFYPFCSERCKLIDLGRWLGGKYQIPCVEDDEGSPREMPPDDDDEDSRGRV